MFFGQKEEKYLQEFLVSLLHLSALGKPLSPTRKYTHTLRAWIWRNRRRWERKRRKDKVPSEKNARERS